MRILLTALLCMVLCGCAQHPAAEEALPSPTQSRQAAQLQSALEARYPLSVTILPETDVQNLLETDAGLLVLSGSDSTKLTLLDETLSPKASLSLEVSAEVSQAGPYLACYDPQSRELLLLTAELEEHRRIVLPPEQTGTPVVSADGNTVYYGTSNAIYCWDLESGIRRRLKELPAQEHTVTGLLCQDTVLQYQASGGTYFLDAETGKLLKEFPGTIQIQSQDKDWYASFTLGMVPSLVFSGEPMMTWIPEHMDGEHVFLPSLSAAVTISGTEQVTLEAYDLTSGKKLSSLELDPLHRPKALVCGDAELLLLVQDPAGSWDALLHWPLPDQSPDSRVFTEVYYPSDVPDQEGLALCQQYADAIGSRYGVEVLVGKQALSPEPWDYDLEAEHRCSVIWQQLEELDACLARYPQELIAQTAADFQGLTFRLVRTIRGKAPSETLQTATGLQFLEEDHAYVVIAAGKYASQALYHELFHVMDTHILSRSTALDRWEILNPAGFAYDLDYAANRERNAGVYLDDHSRAFVDIYSMSYPREDRARIFEYAMLPRQESLFRSDIMQEKLRAICTGIREAYGLKKNPEEFPWEQYLE